MISVDTRALAAKFRSDHDGARRYHPLACHMAALHLLEGWAADGAARGFYLALPTQATANQMHGRVADFLRNAFTAPIAVGEDVNLVLAHGVAWLRDLERLPQGVYDEDGPRPGAVGAGEWFLSAKRSLLAPYGVGTIDQALKAVLQVKHVFVRLYGLAGKAVVIHEVHAYDTYMTGLLERLLEWLGALGSPVVLLSATLPTGRRLKLAEAYARGRGDVATEGEPVATSYPRMTWLEGGKVCADSFEAADRSKRSLKLNKIGDSEDVVRDLLLKELAGGGCAVVICNTVGRAQEMYRALQGPFESEELGLSTPASWRRTASASKTTACACLARPTAATSKGRPAMYWWRRKLWSNHWTSIST